MVAPPRAKFFNMYPLLHDFHMIHLSRVPPEVTGDNNYHLLLSWEARCDMTNTIKQLSLDGRAFQRQKIMLGDSCCYLLCFVPGLTAGRQLSKGHINSTKHDLNLPLIENYWPQSAVYYCSLFHKDFVLNCFTRAPAVDGVGLSIKQDPHHPQLIQI